MTRSGHRLRAAAKRTALGLVLAGACAGGAQAATSANHAPLRGHYPGSYATPAACATAPVPAQRWPNHRPLRGNYPGSYAAGGTCHVARLEQ